MRTDPHRRGEVGQSMIVVMLFLPVLLAVAAILIDVTGLFGHKRSLQNRADATALAAAQALDPTTGTCTAVFPLAPAASCVSVLNDYYATNGGLGTLHPCVDTPLAQDTNCYAAPYVTSAGVVKIGKVEVRLKDTATLALGGVVGLKTADIHARAVATQNTRQGNTAFFAHSTDCLTTPPAFFYSGGSSNSPGTPKTVDGTIVSNGSVDIHGHNGTYGELDYRTPCTASLDNTATFTSVKTYSATRDYPLKFDQASILPCTYSGAAMTISAVAHVIPPGVYCASVSATFDNSTSSSTGNITVIAPTIDFGGNNVNLTPFWPKLVFFATGSGSTCNLGPNIPAGDSGPPSGAKACMYYHSNNSSIGTPTGISTVYVPNGQTTIDGNSFSGTFGFVESEKIYIIGNTAGWAGVGPDTSGAPQPSSLTE